MKRLTLWTLGQLSRSDPQVFSQWEEEMSAYAWVLNNSIWNVGNSTFSICSGFE